MKINTLKPLLLLSFTVLIIVSSCKYYVQHSFRQTYEDYNTFIHSDTTNISYFKAHFKNGDVCVLDEWHLDESKEYLIGSGVLYDFNRVEIIRGHQLSFTINSIAIIETNQLDQIQSKDNSRIAALSVISGINIAIGAYCLANPKACFGSCPTFYLDGKDYFHDASAEGFSSSISPSLEKEDLDALQYRTQQNTFNISMKNEAFETHAINQIKLLAVPVQKKQGVYHNKEGRFYVCNEVLKPTKANASGQNIRKIIKNLDDQEYFSKTDPNDLSVTEDLFFEFDTKSNAQYGLLLNFRQTQLTTFLFYSSLGYMGDKVADYFAMIETKPLVRKRLDRFFYKLGEINIHYWDESKQAWIYTNTVFETGPIAKNLQIIALPANASTGKKVKIKVELSKGAWRVDYVGLAAIDKEVKAIEISPFDVQHKKGDSQTLVQQVNTDDNSYLTSFPGDVFKFKFQLPSSENDNYHELFLSSKGYYLEWMRDAWLKEKNTLKLRKMLLNDKQTWQDLAREFKTVEHEMEEVFWESKYKGIQ